MNAMPLHGIREGNRVMQWPDVLRRAHELRATLRPDVPRTVLVQIPSGLHLAVLLLAARDGEMDLIIAGPGASRSYPDVQPELVLEPRADGTFGSYEAMFRGQSPCKTHPGVSIQSSGTTGAPHLTHWTWDELTRGKLWAADTARERWAIGYAPHTYAAVTALCQALGRATTVEFIEPCDLSTTGGAAPMDVVAATPSFWRLAGAAAHPQAPKPAINTATVGGEPLDQALIDRIRKVFAPQRINQIYATSEFGTLLALDDELPGLPAAMQDRRLPNGMAFTVGDQQLQVSRAPGEPFLPTGDIIEQSGNRLIVIGRVGVQINVGGNKANPHKVVQVLQQHPDVIVARAYPLRSPVLGKVVAADIVAVGPAPDPERLTADLKRHCHGRLEPHERPMRIQIVDDIPLGTARKMVM